MSPDDMRRQRGQYHCPPKKTEMLCRPSPPSAFFGRRKEGRKVGRSELPGHPPRLPPSLCVRENRSSCSRKREESGDGDRKSGICFYIPQEDDRHPPCGPRRKRCLRPQPPAPQPQPTPARRPPEPGTRQEGQGGGGKPRNLLAGPPSKGAIKALGKINATGTDPKSASCNTLASCSPPPPPPGKPPDLLQLSADPLPSR